jgi:hypothetical protein
MALTGVPDVIVHVETHAVCHVWRHVPWGGEGRGCACAHAGYLLAPSELVSVVQHVDLSQS